jgi:hypothetical protein
MGNAQLQIILCSTVFTWSPLLFNAEERNELIYLMETFKETHLWRTSCIIDALKAEWGID